MSNKKFYQMFVFVFVAATLLFGSMVSAVTFKIEFENESHVRPQYMKRNMTPIHFKDNGNDFGGFLYFANGVTSTGDSSEEPVYIETTDGNDAVECMQMVKGFYYNAERGERLWPLDPNTAQDWGMGDLELKDGIFTRCHGSGYSAKMNECANETYYPTEASREGCEMKVAEDFSDTHGYYGHLSHTYKGLKFGLIVGTNYKSGDKIGVYIKDPLTGSFIRYDNKYPVGFVYDYNGGAGFVGCVITGVHNIGTLFDAYITNDHNRNKLFSINEWGTGLKYKDDGVLECGNMGSAKNTLLAVIVDGLVGMSSNLKGENKNSGIEGNQGNEKMQYFSSVDINNTKLINYARQKAEILCRGKWKNYVAGEDINCVLSNDEEPIVAPLNKTLIVKGGADVKVYDMTGFGENKYYDIFVDNGNLIIDDTGLDLFVFKKNGFISNEVTTVSDFRDKVYDAWNEPNGEYKGEEVAVGKFMKGNFIVNGKIKSATSGLENVYFVYGKLTSLDSVEDLKSTFRRKCNIGTGSDGNPCPISIDGWENPYENASLVIIDQNYPSPLYQ